MKKITILIILMLVSINMFSQIIPIKDSQSNVLFGYVVFQKVEKVDRKTNSYMATLLDINLNRVSQAAFTDIDDIKVGNTLYNGNNIYFEVIPTNVSETFVPTTVFSYRIYDLKDNKISSRYELPNPDKKTVVRGSYAIHGKGFGVISRSIKTHVNEFQAFDDNNKPIYHTKPYGNPKKKKGWENIDVGDVQSGLLASISRKYPKSKSSDPRTTVLLTDAVTGKNIKEVSFDEDDYKVDLYNIQIIGDRIYAFGDTYTPKKELNSGKTAGMFKAVMDLEGNVLHKKNAVWAALQSKLDIKEGGFVKKNGYIYTHHYALDPETNHTVVVGEYIKGGLSSVTVKDMVFMDFDENFNLSQVFEVPTNKSVLSLGGIKMGGSRDYGKILKDYNYFDYRFANELEESGGLSFFYFNVEKSRFFSNSEFSRGMVVYKDGKFSSNKLKYETNSWKNEHLNILPAKPGYILVTKINKGQLVENRLERLEY